MGMEWSTAVLPSQRVNSTAFCLEVCRNGLDGLSKPSPLCSIPLIGQRSHVCSHPHNISRGIGGFSMVKVRPILKINAAVDDNSSHLSGSAEDEQTMKDHPGRKDGVLQWIRSAVARRAAQKEELTSSLKRYGVAGILSYGLLNTAYYLAAFLFVWFYVAPSPGGLGFVPAAQRFFRIFATVWAGSQVTKLFRAAGALSLAPFVDRGLNWFTQRFNFKSRGTAFSVLVGACFGLAALVFLVITILWS